MVATGAFAAIWKRGTSMFKHTKLHPLLAGTALLAALPLAVCAQGKEPIRIGLVTSKSGGFSTMGADVARGIGFAGDEAHAKGGGDGRRVILAEGDDERTPAAGPGAGRWWRKARPRAPPMPAGAWPRNWPATDTIC